MPVRLALSPPRHTARAYGLFPICWTHPSLPVIFLYQLTVKTGRFTALQTSLTNITEDGRLQLLLIAFALGAFFEGTAGFGNAPVAVCGAILISLGFKPIQAAGLSLIANTAPVAFGALGCIPDRFLYPCSYSHCGIDVLQLTKVTAIILVPFCLLVPKFWVSSGSTPASRSSMIGNLAGHPGRRRHLRLCPILHGRHLRPLAGRNRSLCLDHRHSHHHSCVCWKPKRILNPRGEQISNRPQTSAASQWPVHSKQATFKAWLPWLVLSVVVFAWGLPQISKPLDKATTINLPVPGLHNVVQRVPR